MKKLITLIFISMLTKASFNAQKNYNYPSATKENVVDDYFGTKVADPYRWLEDDQSSKTEEWVKLENITTENYLII